MPAVTRLSWVTFSVILALNALEDWAIRSVLASVWAPVYGAHCVLPPGSAPGISIAAAGEVGGVSKPPGVTPGRWAIRFGARVGVSSISHSNTKHEGYFILTPATK